MHGHTYQCHPVACAAALEVQRIIREDDLLENVKAMGTHLSERLRDMLSEHPNVGDIRGRGLFWGIELVADKATKEPFPAADNVAFKMAMAGQKEPYSIAVYPSSGTKDGKEGDHIILSPPYNTTTNQIDEIVYRVHLLVGDYFRSMATQNVARVALSTNSLEA